MIRAPAIDVLKGIQHCFLTRVGGVSTGDFSSLNCGYGSGDLEKNVHTNLSRALQNIGLGTDDLTTVHQIHSKKVVEVRKPWPVNERPRADGMVTCVPGLALGILTADCVPVLLTDVNAGVIGAAHAGWKGALAGVAEATLAAMEKLGARRKNTVAAIGPCIRQPSYEVGPELRDHFVSLSNKNHQYFIPSVNINNFMFDLAAFVRDSLTLAGIDLVDDTKHDTYENGRLFFSYRRGTHMGEKKYGRNISLISLEKT